MAEPTDTPDEIPDDERRQFTRRDGAGHALVIDLGFGPLETLDWSLGGARLKGRTFTLAVGEFATGHITARDAQGEFIADVVRIHPPHLDPRRPPDEVSLRWLELPPAVLDAMIALDAERERARQQQISQSENTQQTEETHG